MHDLIVGLCAFLLAEVQLSVFMWRARKERDEFLKAFEHHLKLYRRVHRHATLTKKSSGGR